MQFQQGGGHQYQVSRKWKTAESYTPDSYPHYYNGVFLDSACNIRYFWADTQMFPEKEPAFPHCFLPLISIEYRANVLVALLCHEFAKVRFGSFPFNGQTIRTDWFTNNLPCHLIF